MIEASPPAERATDLGLPAAFYACVAVLVLLTGALLTLTDGNVAVALAPSLVIALVWAMFKLPIAYSCLGVFTATVLFHNPGGRPHGDLWQGPLYPLGALLYPNLRLILNIDALRFNAIELLLVLLLLVLLVRWVAGSRIDVRDEPAGAAPLRTALTVAACAMVVWIVYGMARGGDFKQMLWQTRQLLWAPILSGIFMRAFKTPTWHRALGWTVIGIAMLRALDGIYFWRVYVIPRALFVEYAITHDDSILFGTTMVLIGLLFFERFGARVIMLSALVVPVVGYGLVINHRRLAYVGMAASAGLLFLVLRRDLRRRIIKLCMIGAPILLLYIAVGTQSSAGMFAPVRSLMSVMDRGNASNQTRDIENYNLISTIHHQPVLGLGFGHEYTEYSVAYDIAKYMPNYRYIAHNSVLWLLMLTGLVGFTLLWLYYAIGVFYAARIYKLARDRLDAVAALTSAAVIVLYVFQAYGDMGMISWMGTFMLAAAMAVIGNLAARTPGVMRQLEVESGDETPPADEPLRGEQVA